MFISKDENLTKAHIKYLESRIIQMATTAKRYKIGNGNQPQLSALPLADRDAMEEFLLQIKMLVGIMDHKILEEVIDSAPKPRKDATQIPVIQEVTISNIELYLSIAGMNAKAIQTNEGIVVLEGSDASSKITSLSLGYKNLRQRLIDTGALQLNGDRYKFKKDVLFTSASAAAAIIVGHNANGPQHWKNSQDKSLKMIEEEQ